MYGEGRYFTLLREGIVAFSKVFLLFIDALDESPDDTKYTLFKDIRNLPPVVHTILTSRDNEVIRNELQCAARIKTRANKMTSDSILSIALGMNLS